MSTRVLVVDDEETIRGLLVQVLEEEGYEPVEAPNAERALELHRASPFPLILTDIYMGKMTGIDLLRQVRGADNDSMVVVMTSNASIETATEALRAGAYDYLLKPFDDIGAIATVVNRAIERHQLIVRNRELMEDMKRKSKQLETLNAKLTDMANCDGLTGLYNHRYLRQALDTELSRATRHDRRFALVFIDIDHFKSYNDTYGHLAGDALLGELGRMLLNRARHYTVAARYGGEEFLLIVPEADASAAHAFAEDLRAKVEAHPFPGRDTQPLGRVTLSIGVAPFPEAGEEATVLLDNADKALYQAKREGRNRVVVWQPLVRA